MYFCVWANKLSGCAYIDRCPHRISLAALGARSLSDNTVLLVIAFNAYDCIREEGEMQTGDGARSIRVKTVHAEMALVSEGLICVIKMKNQDCIDNLRSRGEIDRVLCVRAEDRDQLPTVQNIA